jgi:hypothetical protein
MTTFKIDPIIIDDPKILRRTADIEILSIDVVPVDLNQLQLRLSGTTDLVLSPYRFDTGCAQSFSARFTFRGGFGSVTVAATSQSYQDDDRDGVVLVTLGSPGEHTLEITMQPAATAGQQGVLHPDVPTTKVVLRPDINCPQPKVMA